MGDRSAVGVDDDLTPRQATVALRAADDETPGRVDQDLGAVRVEELLGDGRLDDRLQEVGLDLVLRALLMLGAYEDLVDGDGAVALVAHRDLALAVGPEVVQLAVLAHLGEALGEPVGQADRQRHQLVGLLAGEAEHHALVARADLVQLLVGAVLQSAINALRDVRRLRVDAAHDAAGLVVEAELGARVADLLDLVAHQRRDVDVGLGGHLSGDEDEARGTHRLAGNAAVGILGKRRVEDGVGDLIRYLVGMTLGYGLGCEKMRSARTSTTLSLGLRSRNGIFGHAVIPPYA